MNTKLFIGNLSWGINDESLRAAFELAGTVTEAIVIKDRETGRSRGFAFVTMASEAEAQAAIEMYHEKEIDGRQVIVNIARPRNDES